MEDLKQAQELAEQINIEEKMFGWAATKYGGLAKLISSLEPYYNLWMTTFDFYDKSTACMNQPFKSIDAEQMDELVNDMCVLSMFLLLHAHALALHLMARYRSLQFMVLAERNADSMFRYRKIFKLTKVFSGVSAGVEEQAAPLRVATEVRALLNPAEITYDTCTFL